MRAVLCRKELSSLALHLTLICFISVPLNIFDHDEMTLLVRIAVAVVVAAGLDAACVLNDLLNNIYHFAI